MLLGFLFLFFAFVSRLDCINLIWKTTFKLNLSDGTCWLAMAGGAIASYKVKFMSKQEATVSLLAGLPLLLLFFSPFLSISLPKIEYCLINISEVQQHSVFAKRAVNIISVMTCFSPGTIEVLVVFFFDLKFYFTLIHA